MRDNPLVGKKIEAVYLASDDKAIRFDTEDGESIIARADGDCCSSTWIESLDAPELLTEGEVTSVEELFYESKKVDIGEVVKNYGCKISTTKGRCVIDYRNRSNGYYGGNLAWPDDYFYGGVFEQNISNEDWEKIA